MDEGVLSVRQSHFSSTTQEAWGYPPPQSRASRDEKCGRSLSSVKNHQEAVDKPDKKT